MTGDGANIQRPVISVVTVELNAENALERTIKSVLPQRIPGVEYIIVDGGSEQNTLGILQKYDRDIDYWLSESDRGISNAFNKGINAARGALVGILSAGDWYEPDALQMVTHVYRAHPEADVLCGGLRFWERGKPTIVAYSNPSRLERETSLYHPAVFITRSAYEKYGVYDERYQFAMDYELLLRFKQRGAQFAALDAVLANMSLDGVSYKHWYRGLSEVRRVRSAYFTFPAVAYRHSLAVFKNVGARLLKRSGLGILYQKHWERKSRGPASRAH